MRLGHLRWEKRQRMKKSIWQQLSASLLGWSGQRRERRKLDQEKERMEDWGKKEASLFSLSLFSAIMPAQYLFLAVWDHRGLQNGTVLKSCTLCNIHPSPWKSDQTIFWWLLCNNYTASFSLTLLSSEWGWQNGTVSPPPPPPLLFLPFSSSSAPAVVWPLWPP